MSSPQSGKDGAAPIVPPAVNKPPEAPPPNAAPVHEAPPIESPRRDAESVGAGISAAAANPGGTATRSDQVRQARASFTALRFDGSATLRDAVAGNQTNITWNHNGPAVEFEAGTLRLTKDFVVSCLRTFVRPAKSEDLMASRGRHRVAVLRAPSGAGKSTSAVWMLSGGQEDAAVFRLSPDTRPGKLSVDTLTKSAGYLLEDLSGAAAIALTAFDLERLDGELAGIDARLVITVRPETSFTDGGVEPYVLDVGARPEPMEVLRSHLNWRLRNSEPGLADRLRGRSDVGELLRAELSNGVPLNKAAVLARLVAAHAERPDTLVAGVRAQLSRSDEQDFTTWFTGLTDLHLQCFAIALSIFNGLPYETVADTGLLLHRKFDVVGSTAVATRARPEAASPFGDGRSSRLHKLRAEVGRAEVRTRYGTVPAEVVRYTDTSFPVRVLHHVWQEHDRARNGLIAWLRDLGGHQSQTVRIRAATAVGVLTGIAYDHIRHEVLVDWAGSGDGAVRDSAAIALVGPADDGDPALAAAVRNLLEEWGYGTVQQRATAARALGTSVGLRSLDTCLTALERFSEDEDFDVVDAVCQSLTELVASGLPDASSRVLGRLHDWSTSRRETRRIVGHLAFLLMAADLVTKRPTGSWPSLLWIAYTSRDQHDVVARLWGSAISAAASTNLALVVLAEWAELVDADDTARAALVGVLRSACETGRVSTRVRRHVQKWTTTDSGVKAARTTADLLAVLPQEGR